MKKLLSIGLMAFALGLGGCTEQQRARSYGGSTTVQLAPHQRLVNVTWKGADLWILTRPMHPDEKAETYQFGENSSYGLIQGVITLREME